MHLPSLVLCTALLSLAPLAALATPHFDSCSERTGNNATLIIPASSVNLNGSTLDTNDELALFTPNGVCAGQLMWDGDNAALALWEDDPMTEDREGFVEGEAMTYVMWDASHSQEYGRGLGEIAVSYDTIFEDVGVFIPDAIYQVAEINVIAPVDTEDSAPSLFSLDSNYPNPFSQRTTIQYEIGETSRVKLEVYDMIGHRVGVLVDEMLPAGQHEARFNPSSELASGVYLYRIQAGGFSSHRKMTLIN